MSEFLDAGVTTFPHRPALTAPGRTWSYVELWERVEAWARAVGERARGPGPVVLLLPPGPEGVVAIHAVARSGRVVAPLNPRLTAGEAAVGLAALGPSLVLHDGTTGRLAPRATSHSAARSGTGRSGEAPPWVDIASFPSLDAGGTDGTAGSPPPVQTGEGRPRGPTSPATTEDGAEDAPPWAVLWTSGTGGRSRGVALSAANLRASAEAVRERLELSPDDRWYASLSLAHVGGLALVTRAALLGSCVVVTGGYDEAELLRLAAAEEITHASLVPTMLHRILTGPDAGALARLRCVLLGGARASRPLIDRALAAGVPLALTYGLTEAASQVATAAPELVRRKRGTVGEPLRGVFACISEAGEVLVRGATVALGYVGADEPLLDDDGWLHTGDLGELDPEGHLWVTGRHGDRIITGGVNVDPAEVEDVLLLHQGVADAAVVGLEDLEWGEIVAAAVVRAPGLYPDPAELETLARARLTTAKIPRRWLFLETLPRNPNGKVDRVGVRGAFG